MVKILSQEHIQYHKPLHDSFIHTHLVNICFEQRGQDHQGRAPLRERKEALK